MLWSSLGSVSLSSSFTGTRISHGPRSAQLYDDFHSGLLAEYVVIVSDPVVGALVVEFARTADALILIRLSSQSPANRSAGGKEIMTRWPSVLLVLFLASSILN